MEYLGFLVELLLFALGVYLYLFATGRVRVRNPTAQARAEEFRRGNAGWMRLLGLALAAIMLVNLIVHIMQFSKM